MKIAWKYIREYKKRSIAMILSIALSVFLVVTIGSLAESTRVLQVNDAKKDSGLQHVRYDGVNMEQVNKIKEYQNVKKVANSFYYDGWNHESGLTVNILGAEKNILYMESNKMKVGRFSTKSNEIAVEEWVLDRLRIPHELNQTIKISLAENGEKEFKLVGIIENNLDKQSVGNLEAYVAFNDENLAGRENHIYSFVEFKEDLNYRDEAKKLGKQVGVKDEKRIVLNRGLLTAMGELNAIDWDLVKKSLFLMVVGGMVIYSIYNISVLKRVQEYGMMRAIGSTKKQIIYVILSELFIVYMIGVLLGILLGVFFTNLFKGSTMSSGLFTEIDYKLDIVVISRFAIGLAMLTSFGSILLSAIRGSILVNRVSPVEAINRSTQDSNIKFKERESFIEKVLTIPKKVSYKNLRRNKKTIIFTIVSMAVGCTLFMVQTFKTELWTRDWKYRNSIDKSQMYEFRLNTNEGRPMKEGYTTEQIDEISKLPQVQDVSFKQVLYSELKINKKILNGIYGKNYIKFMNSENGFLKDLGDFSFEGVTKDEMIIRNTILGLSDRDLKSLSKGLKEGQIDIDQMKNEPVAVVHIPKVNEKGLYFDHTGKSKSESALNLKVGDKITVTIPKKGYDKGIDTVRLLAEHDKSQYIDQEFTIIGITDVLPDKDGFHLGTDLAPYLFISGNMFKELSGIDKYRLVRVDMKDNYTEGDYKILKEEVQKMSEIIPGTLLEDRVEYLKEAEKSDITYDLLKNSISIILILISGLSIYNNINYNLISRIREHGIMKAIGLTKKQFRNMIRFEGLIYGIISATFSCAIALMIELGIFIYYAYIFDKYSEPVLLLKRFFIEWKSFLIVIAINLSIGYIATIGPRRQVDKIEITDAIRAVE